MFNLPNTVTRGVKWILAQGRIYVCLDPGPKVDWSPLKYTKKLRHLHSTWLKLNIRQQCANVILWTLVHSFSLPFSAW